MSEKDTKKLSDEDTEKVQETEPDDVEKLSHSHLINETMEWAESFMFSLLIVILLFTFILRVVRVDGPSMNNTLTDGDRVVLTHLNYTPKRDDIVVVAKDDDKNIIKRVIGVEGDDVVIDYNNDSVTVNGVQISNEHNLEPMEDTCFFDGTYRVDTGVYEYKVPDDCVFLMGDNRNISSDSRIIGFVSEDTVMGKVIFRVAPLNSIGIPR